MVIFFALFDHFEWRPARPDFTERALRARAGQWDAIPSTFFMAFYSPFARFQQAPQKEATSGQGHSQKSPVKERLPLMERLEAQKASKSKKTKKKKDNIREKKSAKAAALFSQRAITTGSLRSQRRQIAGACWSRCRPCRPNGHFQRWSKCPKPSLAALGRWSPRWTPCSCRRPSAEAGPPRPSPPPLRHSRPGDCRRPGCATRPLGCWCSCWLGSRLARRCC